MPENEQKKVIKVPRFEERYGFSTTLQRSLLMSKIKGKNTSPEILFRKIIWKSGLRYRLHNKNLPGNPDIFIKKHRLVIFIDGEFWHGYNWEQKRTKIKTNRDFWIPKIERNMQRDISNNEKLTNLGFRVFRFWEHRIKKDIEGCVKDVMDFVHLNST